MRQTLTLLFATLLFGTAAAQPDWAKKASKSLFTLKTFDAKGTLLASSNGFFVGERGEAVSSFTPFNGAAKAIVIGTDGREMPVSAIIGANSTYDVAKFRVGAKRTVPLTVARSAATVGTTVWILPYSANKKPQCIEAKVSKTETFQTHYTYYSLSAKGTDNTVSCPLLNAAGEAVGLMQLPSSDRDTVGYAVSALFADSLRTNGLSINDATLNRTSIKKELPDDQSQAILALYVGGSVLDSAGYAALVNDFIAKFPDAPDGYISRAQLNAQAALYAEADRDMAQAIKVAEKKDDAHFNYSKLIYQKAISPDSASYPQWTLEKAAEEIQTAYAANPISLYREFEAQIRFAQKQYDNAFNIYSQLIESSGKPTAELYFLAARCKEMTRDTAAVLALLDSAVNTFSKPYLKTAAPYILARAQALLSKGEYRKAVADFNDYESLMRNEVNANFYYIRARAETEGRIFQAALNDYAKAIRMEPKNTLYLAEKAALEIRVNLLDDAIKTAEACIAANPAVSDGHLFLGLAQCLKGDKAQGRQNMQKAKELGDPQAQELMDKYAN